MLRDLAVIPDVVVAAVTLGAAAHQPGELVPGELPVPDQDLQQRAQVQLRPAHREPVLQLGPVQAAAAVTVNQVKCLPRMMIMW